MLALLHKLAWRCHQCTPCGLPNFEVERADLSTLWPPQSGQIGQKQLGGTHSADPNFWVPHDWRAYQKGSPCCETCYAKFQGQASSSLVPIRSKRLCKASFSCSPPKIGKGVAPQCKRRHANFQSGETSYHHALMAFEQEIEMKQHRGALQVASFACSPSQISLEIPPVHPMWPAKFQS